MSELNTVARPYAQAAFDMAREGNALAQWSEMIGFAAAVSVDHAMREAIASPGMSSLQQAELFTQVCADRLDSKASNFIRLLAENRRLTVLPEIAVLFNELRADAEGTIEATVISAKPLTDAQQKNIAGALKARFKREVTLTLETDESILGGAIIRAGDTVIDGSIRGKLEQFARALV